MMGSQKYFNSRPSARGDHGIQHGDWAGAISIHAPPRGATLGVMLATIYNFISIHAPPRGATADSGDKRQWWGIFQFTPLREGRRQRPKHADGGQRISIHAPPRGATRQDTHPLEKLLISIHAPPRGATLGVMLATMYNYISIHAPPRGATKIARGHLLAYQISIHAPPRGAT